MVIGTMFLGKVKEVNKQSVQTKFLIIGVPLVPLSSMLVTKSSYNRRHGVAIPLNVTSVIAGYARLFSIIGAGVLLLVSLESGDKTYQISALLLAAVWAYFMFVFGKPTKTELATRTKLGDAIGLYALPEWFDFNTALNNFKSLQSQYKVRFANSDWKEDLNNGNIPVEKHAYLYAIAMFNYMVDSSEANEALLIKAEAI